MDNAAAASETAKGLLISPGPQCTTDKTDAEFRGVLQDPEVLSPSTESLLRGPKRSFCGVEGAGRESTSGSCSTPLARNCRTAPNLAQQGSWARKILAQLGEGSWASPLARAPPG